MKKFLFLMLSLAVSASAIAGVKNAERITKKQQLPTATRMLTKQNSSMPGILKMSKQQVNSLFSKESRVIDKSQLRAAVTEQPEGTVKIYQRTGGTALWLTPSGSSYNYTPGTPSGTVTVVEDGSTVWFKNLLYDPNGYFPIDYWIKGTKSGARITITLGQEIYNHSTYGNLVLGMGNFVVSNGSLAFTPITSTSTVQFSISTDKKTLTLQGTTPGEGTYAAYTGTGLCAYWEDDGEWDISMEWNTTLTYDENTPEAPTMYTDDDIEAMTGGEEVPYYRKGYAFVYDEEGDSIALVAQNGYAWIYYASDGSVYMRDPVYGFQTNYWVKGTKSDNKITVPLNQYIAWTSNFLGLKTAWGEMGEEDFTYDTAGEVTYTIADQTITLDNCEYSETSIKGLALVLDSAYVDKGWYGYLDLYTTYIAFPDAPENVTVTPAATTAEVTWTDTDNEQWNIRYRVYNAAASNAYSNDFEDSLAGWGVTDADGDGDYWGRYYDPDDENNHVMGSYSYNITPDNWLFSPNILITEGSVVSIKAGSWAGSTGASEEIFSIMIARDTAEYLSSFVALPNAEDLTASTFQVYNFNIPEEYIGDSCCIAIRHTGGAGYFLFDDFFVGNPDATPNAWIYVNDITEIPYTLTGLTPETTYELNVQAVNAGGVGDWSEVTMFTTLAQSSYLRGDVDGSGTVDITDATTLINYLLNGSANPFVEDNADVDFSGGIDITDATTLINFLLTGNWPE